MKTSYLKSMVTRFPTEFWNDSCMVGELEQAIERGAVCATSNPPLVYKAILDEKTRWHKILTKIFKNKPGLSREELTERLTEQVIISTSKVLLPLYEKTNRKYGLLSVQVNPLLCNDADGMVRHAQKLNSLMPNLSIKIPVTKAGLEAIEILTEYGINTTATVSFSVSQVIQVAEAYRRGLYRRDPSNSIPKSFAVIMAGRLDDHLKEQVRQQDVKIPEDVVQQAGVAVVKKAYQIYTERRYESRLLVAGMRGLYHVTEFIGGNLIMTIPPVMQQQLDALEIEPQERATVMPSETIIKELMTKLVDFRRAFLVKCNRNFLFEILRPEVSGLRMTIQ